MKTPEQIKEWVLTIPDEKIIRKIVAVKNNEHVPLKTFMDLIPENACILEMQYHDKELETSLDTIQSLTVSYVFIVDLLTYIE